MDKRSVDVSDTDVETDSIASNPVLTLITTEDGIPTSTEVTVLTTTLEVATMTTSLGTLASDVPLVTSHPTFVTSHPGVSTVYATSITPAHAGPPVVVGEGRITVLDTDGIEQTIVVHTDPSQLSVLTAAPDNEPSSQLIRANLVENLSTSDGTETNSTNNTEPTTSNEKEMQKEPVVESLSQGRESPTNPNISDSLAVSNRDTTLHENKMNEISECKKRKPLEQSTSEIQEKVQQTKKVDSTHRTNKTSSSLKPYCDNPLTAMASSSPAYSPAPDEVVCLICYQAFLNPKRGRTECSNEKDLVNQHKNRDDGNETCYGRTLGNFFEISRINMSIVTRRSYKDYDVPICQSCNSELTEAERILEEMRHLERELYSLRQRIKDEILNSHEFFKKKENSDLADARRNMPALVDILDVIDQIRDDIIYDGRPPKIPKSVNRSNKLGRKQKKRSNSCFTESNEIIPDTKGSTLANKDTNSCAPVSSLEPENAEARKNETHKAETDALTSADIKIEKPGIRTSFGRLIKRPTYMINNEMSNDDDLSDFDESSEDNYEEIEVKPEFPPVGESSVIVNDDEMDEEDPAWSPGRGMLISDRIGIPPSSSDESENCSELDSDTEPLSKVRVKKEPKLKKTRRGKQTYKRKAANRAFASVKREDVNYEVKVIQLDGTELMTINTAGPDDNIGLEPDITQKVMDSQAVIMVKNQLFGKRVQCQHCSRTFTDPHRRDIHVKKKHEGVTKPFECQVCQKRFSRQDHLKNHMKRHMRPPKDKIFKPKPSTSEKNHSCEFCELRFRNKSELAVHTRQHTGEKPYKCEHCAVAFVSSLKREFHIEQMHPDVPPLRCEFCPKGFFRQHRLRIHAVSHTGEKANICELCGKSFSQAAMLRYHQTTHEELNLKQFKCQECNRVFANPQNLKSHMESQHQKMYRHRCPHCDRGYTQMSHLRRHLRTHSGEQPFICSYCPKRFTSGAALKIHIRIHTGERPYWCSLCEKGFRSKTKLGRHMKTLIHSGESKDRIKKDTMNTESETVDVNATSTTTWTEIVGIITGV